MTTDKNRKARNTADFKRQRARLLADDPTCTICGAEANTIDHIRPTDTFDNPLDANHPDNLRVLCKSCNSRLGARYVNAKTSGRLPQIDHTERSDFLGEKSFLPDRKSVV